MQTGNALAEDPTPPGFTRSARTPAWLHLKFCIWQKIGDSGGQSQRRKAASERYAHSTTTIINHQVLSTKLPLKPQYIMLPPELLSRVVSTLPTFCRRLSLAFRQIAIVAVSQQSNRASSTCGIINRQLYTLCSLFGRLRARRQFSPVANRPSYKLRS